jgi:hypothetical protein
LASTDAFQFVRKLAGIPPELSNLVRPLPVIVAVGWLAHAGGTPGDAASEPDLSRAVSRALSARGLTADAADVVWLDSPPGVVGSRFRTPRALVRAHTADEPSDVYLVTARLSPEGRVLDLGGVYNLSDTSAVEEQHIVASGERAAWTIGGGGKTYSVHIADLRGERLTGTGWSRLARAQNALTNLQETGQRTGIARRSFKLDPAAHRVSVGFVADALAVDADGRQIRIPTDSDGPIIGERFVQEQRHEKSRPGNLVTWAVDRVRALPWFGSDRMQAVKAVAFEVLDWVERMSHDVTGDDGRERVQEELGALVDAAPTTYTDPETGWPPPPLEPMLSHPLEGEGKWVLLDKDPFIVKNPDAPPPFAFTFIRVDRKRAYAQTYITLWDPRQVRLSAMSGTVEPKSATGETGPGLVPRDPQVMGRLVGAFNGGFQATHGEFGMMAERIVYLPPKPYAATIAELSDGSTAFGTWPKSDVVPEGFVSMRQNMSPLIQDTTINPYKRYWWGGVPPGWTDEARTVRSAVCMTKENFVAYMYGSSIDADHLAIAMQRARCVYGVHLDMNPGHTGLEFYRAAPAGKLPDLGRELDSDWEAKGPISGMPGWEFMGRRMIKFMGLMNFPRYIQREARDFFYLTLRHVLPDTELKPTVLPAETGEGQWQVKGLPQHGWPYALATTWLRPDAERPETKVQILEVDPKTVRAARNADEKEVVVAFRSVTRDDEGERALWLAESGFVIADKSPSPAALRLGAGFSAADPRGASALAAVGVRKASETMIYAEIATSPRAGADGALLTSLLQRLGCENPVLLERPLGVAIGGERDLSGHALPRAKTALRLVRRTAPGARRIFQDTPIVHPDVWYPLQAKRVRYFRKPDAAKASGDAEPTAAAAPPAPAPGAQ